MESAEIETLVNELETRVDRLRALYEQYFMGIERMAPSVPHKDVERRIFVLRKEQIRNTGVRFRFQMIIQRYNTYQTHWQRICRQIEEGTYKRDLLRAQRRMKPVEAQLAESEPPPPAPPAPPVPMPEEAPTKKVALAQLDAIDDLKLDDFADLDRALNAPVANLPVPPKPAAPAPPRPQWRKIEKPAAAPQAAAPAAPQATPPQPAPPAPKPGPPPVPKKPPPPVPAVAAKPAPPPPHPAPAAPPKPAAVPPAPPRSPADIPDDRMRQLYSQYVQTRRAQNESTAAITYDAMAKSLRESSAKLREKHGKAVDFEVTVKDGKTILRPVVKPK